MKKRGGPAPLERTQSLVSGCGSNTDLHLWVPGPSKKQEMDRHHDPTFVKYGGMSQYGFVPVLDVTLLNGAL